MIAQKLKESGYTTHSGKWHLSENPLDYGFDVNTRRHIGHPASYYHPYGKENHPYIKCSETGKYLTDVIMDETLSLDKVDKLFSFIIPYAVHTQSQS